MKIQKIIVFVSLLLTSQVMAQVIDHQVMDDKSMESDVKSFYAETKQVTQFIRRFNSEEDIRGKKLAYSDTGYHDADKRRKFITAKNLS